MCAECPPLYTWASAHRPCGQITWSHVPVVNKESTWILWIPYVSRWILAVFWGSQGMRGGGKELLLHPPPQIRANGEIERQLRECIMWLSPEEIRLRALQWAQYTQRNQVDPSQRVLYSPPLRFSESELSPSCPRTQLGLNLDSKLKVRQGKMAEDAT